MHKIAKLYLKTSMAVSIESSRDVFGSPFGYILVCLLMDILCIYTHTDVPFWKKKNTLRGCRLQKIQLSVNLWSWKIGYIQSSDETHMN